MENSNNNLTLMMAVVAGHKASIEGAYIKIDTNSPVETYDCLKKLNVVRPEMTGVYTDKTLRYRDADISVMTRSAYYVPAGRDMFENWEEAHVEPAEYRTVSVRVPDGFDIKTVITERTRADIYQIPNNALLLHAADAIDQPVLTKVYDEKLLKAPIQDLLKPLCPEDALKEFMCACQELASIPAPKTLLEAIDHEKVESLRAGFQKAQQLVNDRVESLGLKKIFGEELAAKIVSRACSL